MKSDQLTGISIPSDSSAPDVMAAFIERTMSKEVTKLSFLRAHVWSLVIGQLPHWD